MHAQAAGRVVAIGDLHGDLDVTRRALRLAGAIDADDHWIGGPLTVVQTGDVIDRGDDDRAVLDLLERLRADAARAGGALIALCGNHEIMNVSGDLRYVSAKSAAAFGDRAQAFAPGAPYARLLANWPVIAKVADSVFVHGGVLPQHVRYGIDAINREAAAWMRAERAVPSILMREDAPVWTRLYSNDPDDAACAQLASVLRELGAARMIVGHTPQPRGISAACGEKVWRIDTGMSHVFGGALQVLEIEAARVRVRDGG
jgi:Icc-related predicted phosphoesterase